MPGLLAAAEAYAAAGMPVLPLHTPGGDGTCSCGRRRCSSPGKHPRWHPQLISAGLHEASLDPDRLALWWQRWPQANIGLRAGTVFDVCDVDSRPGLRLLRELVGDALAGLPAVRTGSGGLHLYLAPTGLGNRARLLPGVDWRGAGGYVVAPPSVHASGARYRWVRPLPPALPPGPPALPPCPPALRRLLETEAAPMHPLVPVRHPTRYAAAALANESDRVRRAQVGARNDTLYRAARSLGRLVSADLLDRHEVTAALADAALTAGLGATEVDRTIRSGLGAG